MSDGLAYSKLDRQQLTLVRFSSELTTSHSYIKALMTAERWIMLHTESTFLTFGERLLLYAHHGSPRQSPCSGSSGYPQPGLAGSIHSRGHYLKHNLRLYQQQRAELHPDEHHTS
jgi:hypothetical protein